MTAGAWTVRPPRAAAESGRRVAIFGGGVAGLTAAHELAERGFAVTVYERRALGGKARSIPVPGSGRDGRPDLPGEHGFRFFPGFYKHIPDIMRRIPFRDNANGVWDNLVPATEARFSRAGTDDILLPMGRTGKSWSNPDDFRQTVGSVIATSTRMPMTDALYFANRLLVFNTSCDARRFGQWEQLSWRDFVGARGRSAEFRTLMSRTLTTLLVAAKDDHASTRTIGNMGEQFLGNPLEVGNDGPLDRLLNGPTSEAWLDPWVDRLRQLGVRFEHAELHGLDVAGRRIAGARISGGDGAARTVAADHFVLAVPMEVARGLWTPEILTVWPELAAMDRLITNWMTGIQFYLRRPTAIARGHTAYIDSPWSLTSIAQNQFWPRTRLSGYGDGSVHDCLSVDVSDWNTPGLLYGKPAKECTHDEIAREVWAQLQAHLHGPAALQDEDLHSWFLDSGIGWDAARRVNTNADPLLINTAGSWSARPQAHGALENLFLAGDYVRTTIDLATMEGASESARTAVNALLDVAGSDAPRCRVFSLYRAPELEPMRQLDATRYAAGQPNMFDGPV
ncbi:FAD-dependent oxidoreductase [Nocardia sp. CDC159]|uniref:FAD-dependent oxidoreductase n=1 Tax=Nocardia pulmonis TaxID=2951408 RepID=A0A9X2E237_9NOCA|nr:MULTISPECIES: FAD-dependent oxidoreductase [Nocardia]MCM6772667.1 FAD-dependent oxidoreductase [Nocardia pulmonis]MCM6786030.1 FAD-dependent oxidoreductase [Nocardia sp. CDC159]